MLSVTTETYFNAVKLIHSLVKAREKANQATPTLAVVAIGDFDSIDTRLKNLRQTV